MVVRGKISLKNKNKLKPSRFNFHVEDNNLLKVYNSYRGDIVAFTGKEVPLVKAILRRKEIDLSDNKEKELRLIDFLFKKGYLVNLEINEFQLGTSQKYNMLSSERTLQLILLTNEDCNFRCTYCYEDFTKSEMKTDVQLGIIRFLEKNISRYRQLFINWFGGEPLKSFDIIKNLSYKIMEICERYNVHYYAGITTNGYLLDKDTFEQLLDLNVVSYQITLDGTAETHNTYRAGRFGEKTFDKILSNLIAMKQFSSNFTVVLRSNINNEVSAVMNDYISLVSNIFVEDPRFILHFIPIQNLKGEQKADIHLCDTKDLFPLYNKAKKEGFEFNFYKQYLRPGGSQCYASNPSSYVIGSDGMIYKCTVAFNNPYNHVGDLLENGQMILDQERWSLWITGGVNEDPMCTKCFFRPSCQGNACPLERIESNKTPCPPIKKSLKNYVKLVDGDYDYDDQNIQ
ncbi:radical SAM/SPASM domain-containing protein [Paenibacillus larvae]|uniref:radical SAM/SPASM domain-containing protein n=1 Tax=Paenibacillus larvae TaxID=1464 RepID=UPI0028540EDD|nr:radical SAM protein [Paenibacillus larvae]MDR5597866.1 radical SAM protein [Paenibacillus larvae]